MDSNSNELDVGDIVVVIGCEACDCLDRGDIFQIGRTHDDRDCFYSYLCTKVKSSRCLERVVTDAASTRWYPLSWLRTYPHFKNWHGK